MSSKDNKENLLPDKKSPWLDAHFNPVASLNAFTSCIDLADLHADGEFKLVVADLGTGQHNMKLKVYKGTSVMSESAIIDLPTGVSTFFMDTNEPRTPAIAVASGPFIYIYKNLRPYFKFSLPLGEVNPIEKDLWSQAREEMIDFSILYEMLASLRDELGASALTVRSLKFLYLLPEEIETFATVHKHTPLKKQSVVTCMDILAKSSTDEGSISCLVVGAESKDVYILDPEAFTILGKHTIKSVPVFLSVSGLFDVDYRVTVACRDAKVYQLKKGSTSGKLSFEMQSQIVGVEKVGKMLVVGCMDKSITCFTSKGKKLWALYLPAQITTMSILNHKAKGYKALLVALSNAQVRIYREKVMVHSFQAQDVIHGMRFGRFGREEGSLVMTTKGGGLIVKILKRTASFDNVDYSSATPSSQLAKIPVPKKTKLFVDQALREKENAKEIHQVFQSDLFKIRLNAARSLVRTIQTSLNPVSSSIDDPLKLSAQVQGIGPSFKLIISVQNTSSDTPSTGLLLSFMADHKLYKISKAMIQVPNLLPGIAYTYETFVECVTEIAISDKIKVFLLHCGDPVPVITAVINMPVSEAMVVV